MNFTNMITAVDSHTVGQATRVIIGGVPVLKGRSMMEKKEYLRDKFDFIRSSAMLEPRGHADMFGAVLTEPVNPKADYGMIFIDGDGYLNMCGHGTIGVATVLVECGMVKVSEPVTKLTLEAPAGLIELEVKVENNMAKEVSFVNVPAFLYKKDFELEVPELGKIRFDIAYGGNFFAIVRDADLGVSLDNEALPETVHKAVQFLNYLKLHVPVKHPLISEINRIELVEIFRPSKSEGCDVQNMVVLGKGEVDRSPCGTGTCAKLADLHAREELKLNENFVHESIIGTRFKGKILAETEVGGFKAVIPEITGSAYITGINNLLIDQNDPVKNGFILKAK